METRNRLHGDEGSALTEFAIVAPLFIILMFWAEFFVDLGILRLKGEEAARYAVWEMTAQRDVGAVQGEIRERFADLASPEQYQGNVPKGARSWGSAGVTVAVSIQDQGDVKFSGNLRRPSSGGFLGRVLTYVTNFLNRAVDWLIRRFKFKTQGEATATVTFTATNSLFPGGSILGMFLDNPNPPPVTMQTQSQKLIWNTWKAWPGKGAKTSRSVETDPYDTYPRGTSRDSAPEREVAAQVNEMQFFTFGSKVSQFTKYFEKIRLPDPFGATTWQRNQGPITMLPGASPRRSWAPGSGTNLQRFGDVWERASPRVRTVPWSTGSASIDRARHTVPSQVSSYYWSSRGGDRLGTAMLTPSANPYAKMYRCRDAFYLGASREQIKHYSNPRWTRTAFPGCG